MNSITIKFNANPREGDTFSIEDTLRPTVPLLETYVNNGQMTGNVGQVPVLQTIEESIQATFTALLNHYNQSNLYDIQAVFISGGLTINEIRIVANNANSIFDVLNNNTGGRLTITVDNVTVEPSLSIDEVLVLPPLNDADSCSRVRFRITTNVQADNIFVGNATQPVTTLVNVIETSRDTDINIFASKLLTSGSVELANSRHRAPILLAEYFEFNIINTPSGATVSLRRLFPISDGGSSFLLGLTFRYRIRNLFPITPLFQDSSSWSGVPVGNYSIDIIDNLGCILNIPFQVTSFVPNLIDFDSISDISNLNSFGFKVNELIDGCNNRRNQDNSLSHEQDVRLNNRGYVQIFQKCDNIPTQLRSNYENNTARLVNCNGIETEIPVIKNTANMNLEDARDGTITILMNQQIGVYFGTGRTYDPLTLEQNGDYNLGENLMSWINIGDYINIQGVGFVLITDILSPTDELPFQTAVLALNNSEYGFINGDNRIITTVYNSVDYERYEFNVPMINLEGDYFIKVNSTDPKESFLDKEFISEWFNVAEKQNIKHHLIDYYNDVNNEINFGTGIVFRLRIPYVINLKWNADGQQDTYTTDTRTILVESQLREDYSLVARELPLKMAQKLVIALIQNRLQIDGINYLAKETPVPQSLGSTNLYIVRANLVRANYNFENVSGLTSGEILNSSQPLSVSNSTNGLLLT